ncbi:MAG: ssl1498 family light-harvesting-like protein [Cyanobacteriota bacterium]|nr:ssl1498 family light-harvesting-like protein [Cyanobacteriota bacterium]
MYTINKEKTALTLQERIAEIAALEKISETEVRHYSDGSELIPAEVQAKIHRNGGQLPDAPQMAGYTVDDEGLVNAYSIEPAMYFAGYPTPEAQRRYVFQGAIAALLVTLTGLIAFSVS